MPISRIVSRDERKLQREKNQDELSSLLKKSDEIIGRTIDPIQKRHNDLKDQIQKLHDEKQDLLEKPISKEEFLNIAKNNLHAEKKRRMDLILKSHLEKCLSQNLMPLEPINFSAFAFVQQNLGALFAFAITDEDIERAVNEMDEVGISTDERDSKVKKIDNEIARLIKAMESELQKTKE